MVYSHLTDRAMRTDNSDKAFNALTLTALLVSIALLIMYCAGRIREEQDREQDHEYTIPVEVWQEFQDCIEPHPSDGVCDSCWKAIIIDKYHIVNN